MLGHDSLGLGLSDDELRDTRRLTPAARNARPLLHALHRITKRRVLRGLTFTSASAPINAFTSSGQSCRAAHMSGVHRVSSPALGSAPASSSARAIDRSIHIVASYSS